MPAASRQLEDRRAAARAVPVPRARLFRLMVGPQKALSGRRPNIILILADDLGFSDVGCFGSEIPTPNLDGLASRGTRLTQMYNSARCCPSRASLLTGLHPTQAGIGHMVVDTGIPGYRGFLGENCLTIAEVLGTAGYRTAMVGKWHVGGQYNQRVRPEPGPPNRPRPTDRGFQRFYGTLNGGGSYYDPLTLSEQDDPAATGPGFYYTDAINDRAVSMVDELGRGEDPFFLYVAHVAPHWPLHAPEEEIGRHLGRYLGGWDRLRVDRLERLRGLGVLDPTWAISPRDSKAPDWTVVGDRAWEDARMATYAAQVSILDAGIGRILARLHELGIERETLVMFLSDNGGCAELLREDGPSDSAPSHTRDGRVVRPGNVAGLQPGPEDSFMSYGLPWANASNTPFRRYKHWVHEGGISTPFIASWPGEIHAGTLAHSPAHVVDVMATCVELAGARYPAVHGGRRIAPLEGQSLLPVLTGQGSRRAGPLCWEHEGNRAIRLGELKLVSCFQQPWELYDLSRDRTELDDLAARHPRDVERLVSMYEDWARRTGVLPWQEVLARRAVGSGGVAGGRER